MFASEIPFYSLYKPYEVGIIISILQMTKLDCKYKRYIILDIQTQYQLCTVHQVSRDGLYMKPDGTLWDFSIWLGHWDEHTWKFREDHKDGILVSTKLGDVRCCGSWKAICEKPSGRKNASWGMDFSSRGTTCGRHWMWETASSTLQNFQLELYIRHGC